MKLPKEISLSTDGSTTLAHRALDEGIPVYRIIDKEVPSEEARQLTIAAQETMLRLVGATREEIEVILRRTDVTMMVERGEISLEQAELLVALQKQYPQMVSTLEKYELIPHGDNASFSRGVPPSWEQIKSCLNAEALEKARKLEEPTLIIVPPMSRQDLVKTIDAHKVKGQHDTYTYQFDSDYLWSGGKQENEARSWEVAIVTGVTEVPADTSISGKVYKRAKAWVNKYAGQKLDTMNDVRTYLTLMMRSLAQGKPIDEKSWTVLNAKNLQEKMFVSSGSWNADRIGLNRGFLAAEDYELRSRGLVKVF